MIIISDNVKQIIQSWNWDITYGTPCACTFASKRHLAFLNQWKGENDHRNYFTIYLHKIYVVLDWAWTHNPWICRQGLLICMCYWAELKWDISWDYGTFHPLYTHSSNMHAQPSSGDKCLIFGWTLCLLPYFMWANSEGSDETTQMRRLAWAFAGRLCDKYHNLMSWLKFNISSQLTVIHICDKTDKEAIWRQFKDNFRQFSIKTNVVGTH